MREEHLNSCCLCDLKSVAEHSGGVSPLRMAQEKSLQSFVTVSLVANNWYTVRIYFFPPMQREEAMVPFTQGHSSTRVTIGIGYRTRGALSGPSADELPTPHRREGNSQRAHGNAFCSQKLARCCNLCWTICRHSVFVADTLSSQWRQGNWTAASFVNSSRSYIMSRDLFLDPCRLFFWHANTLGLSCLARVCLLLPCTVLLWLKMHGESNS
jgi:hypothetical protein